MLAELTDLAADIDRHPHAVARRAADILAATRHGADRATAAAAATLLARSRRDVREMDAAARSIDEAIELATPLGGDVLADAHMVAASIATYRAGPAVAAEHLERAWAIASESLRPKITIERAITAKRSGRLKEARERYDEAIAWLRPNGDTVVLARVLSNRGVVQSLLGELEAAEADHREAMHLFASRDQDFAVAMVMHNLASVVAATGDVPAALALFDDADGLLERCDQTMFDAHIDRAEALLSVGLLDDADGLLAGAADALAAGGDRYGAAEAMLVRAQVARLAGEPARAAALADRAGTTFAALGSAGLADAAALERLRATVTLHRTDPTTLADAEGLTTRLERDGLRRRAIEALALTATLALAGGRVDHAEELARRCTDAAARLPFVEHRLAATHATAAVLAARGCHREALREIESILAEFDCYRATIGTPDGRRGSALHGSELAALGARLVATSGTAVDILLWGEARRRRLPDRVGPGSDLPDGSTVTDVRELRSVIDELRAVESGESPSGRVESELIERRQQLERSIGRALVGRRIGADRPSGIADPLDRGRALVDAPEFTEWTGVSIDLHGDELIGVVLHRGQARNVRLGDARSATGLAASSRSLLSALARADLGRAGSLRLRYERAIAGLDRIMRSLSLASGPVVLAMPDDLLAAPWCATPTLLDREVTLVASLGDWIASRRTAARRPAVPERVTAVAGPRLTHTQREVEAVLTCYGRTTCVASPSGQSTSRFDDDPAALLLDADIVHVAAHARLRWDNPMWTTIELDGGPVFAHMLTEAGAPRARLVVLSACEAALPTGTCGAPLASFAGMLVEAGVDNVVAAGVRLPDSERIVEVMTFLHGRIAAGASVAAALARTRMAFRDEPCVGALACWGRG